MLPQDESRLAAWLADLAREGLGGLAWALEGGPGDARGREALGTFEDEMGHCPPAARAVLAHVLGRGPEVVVGTGAELEFWRASLAVLGRAGCGEGARAAGGSLATGHGPLVPDLRQEGLESWTQGELVALHGLSIGAWRDSGAWARCESAARWLMSEVQPDNATNRPWAAHVFLRLWAREGDVEARMYAETLVNNCRVTLGKVDRLSGLILGSGARVLGAEPTW